MHCFHQHEVLHYNPTRVFVPSQPRAVLLVSHCRRLCAGDSRPAVSAGGFRCADIAAAEENRFGRASHARRAGCERAADAGRYGKFLERGPVHDRRDGQSAFRSAAQSWRDFWFDCGASGEGRHGYSLAQGGRVSFNRSFFSAASGFFDRPFRDFREEFLRRCGCQSSDDRGSASVRAGVFAGSAGRATSAGAETWQRDGGSLLCKTPIGAVFHHACGARTRS